MASVRVHGVQDRVAHSRVETEEQELTIWARHLCLSWSGGRDQAEQDGSRHRQYGHHSLHDAALSAAH